MPIPSDEHTARLAKFSEMEWAEVTDALSTMKMSDRALALLRGGLERMMLQKLRSVRDETVEACALAVERFEEAAAAIRARGHHAEVMEEQSALGAECNAMRATLNSLASYLVEARGKSLLRERPISIIMHRNLIADLFTILGHRDIAAIDRALSLDD